jgi:hypothetical protein
MDKPFGALMPKEFQEAKKKMIFFLENKSPAGRADGRG